MVTFISDLSKKKYPLSEKVSAESVRHSILNLIQKENPKFPHDGILSKSELAVYREKSISGYLIKEKGELSELEKTK